MIERDGKLYECECAELRRIAAAMPAYVRSAEVRDGHIKACLPDKKTRLIDAINKSLYVVAYWGDMRAFIKLVMLKHRNKFFRVISDRELRDVFVGSTSRSARGDDSKEPVYNSIEDLVKTPDLLIIRLNELGYKNKAAAGILEEAICYRLDRNQPIWLLSNATKPFGAGSFAYSETVWSLIMSLVKFRVEPISPIDGPLDASGGATSMETSPLAPELVQSSPQQTAVSRPKSKSSKSIRSAPDDDESLGGINALGRGVKPAKRF